jgi:uncharacterized membrane protein
MLDLALIEAFMNVLRLTVVLFTPPLLIAILLLSLGLYHLSYLLVLRRIVQQVLLSLPGVACVIVILLAAFFLL